MTINVHPYERVARVIIGAVMISMAFFGPENLWFLVGLLPLVTGVVGWCPPYQLLGVSTSKRK